MTQPTTKLGRRARRHAPAPAVSALLVAAALAVPAPAQAEDDPEISSATWSAERHRLLVKGEHAPREARITVRDARSGERIGSTRADDEGQWRLVKRDVESEHVPCTVTASVGGDAFDSRDVNNRPRRCDADVGDDDGGDGGGTGGGDTGGGGTGGGGTGGGGTPAVGPLRVLAANDLGMHCADLDYRIFSILPPFNVVHAQVIERGSGNTPPRILTDQEAQVTYAATSSAQDPVAAGSINTTSRNLAAAAFKANFWQTLNGTAPGGQPMTYTLGGLGYGALYPDVLAVDPGFTSFCDPVTGVCDSALALFEPLEADVGLPVPDINALYPETGPSVLMVGQQAMPGLSNTPQHFDRFDRDLAFFTSFPFGKRVRDVNWFAADGIPILPVDDEGRVNAYPLMTVAALATGATAPSSTVDIVLPVASEADCQNCHADPLDCVEPSLPQDVQNPACNGVAVSIDGPTAASGTTFDVLSMADAVGETPEQKLINAAKTNILRLHDAKHGHLYRNFQAGALVPMVCDPSDPSDPDCLVNQTPVQCARCHYTPALDLAQAGPVDAPQQGLRGRQQTIHISMSRAMHGHHGALAVTNPVTGGPLFPPMPAPGSGRTGDEVQAVLEETCYQCHPGKRTKCLRGAMAAGGVVCQDCHGDMTQVGDDFTAGLPHGQGVDLAKRVPWAHEPGCQSCHTGDATANLAGLPGAVVADDGVRLLQAYLTGDAAASPIQAPDSPFAESESLYRLSSGHGGVMCEGCHGSTHAIWPNPVVAANDNLAAMQLQGHRGTLSECTTCHAAGSFTIEDFLPQNFDAQGRMKGPHGGHPADAMWNDKHKEAWEKAPNTCRSCHGADLRGTVLSRMAVDRTLKSKEEQPNGSKTIVLTQGTPVSCTQCHERP